METKKAPVRITALKKMQEIRSLLANEEIKDRTSLYRRLKGNSLLYVWLWKNGIIKRDEATNVLYWNNRIPITDHLSQRFVEYNNMYMQKYSKNKPEDTTEEIVETPVEEVVEEQPKAETVTPKPRRKYKRRKPVPAPVTKEWSREISLFWGLIKFKL
jgi:hypothetical protein